MTTLPPEVRARLEREAREEAEAIYVYVNMDGWPQYQRDQHTGDMDQRREAYANAARRYKIREYHSAQQRERLVKYAQHLPGCGALRFILTEAEKARHAYCECGLRELLASLTPNPEDHGTSEGH